MSFLEAILAGHNNPQRLENLYQAARQENKMTEFSANISACYQQTPDNLLYAAWHYRLQQPEGVVERRSEPTSRATAE